MAKRGKPITNYDINTEEGFYLSVAQLLGCEIDYTPYPYSKKTRWNNRLPGNGRFENHGVIRRFNSNNIHVFLRVPQLSGTFNSASSVLDAIQSAKNIVDKSI